MAKKLTPPTADAKDHAHTSMRGAIASVPVLGGPIVEWFNTVIAPPLEKRREKWMADVVEAIEELQSKLDGLTPEQLAENEAFTSAMLEASQAAMRTTSEEKLEALRNAVINVGLGRAPDDDKRAMLMRIIAEYTPWHIRMLKFLHAPSALFAPHTTQPRPQLIAAGISTVLEAAFPELRGQREFYDLVAKDLNRDGMVGVGTLHATMSEHGLFQKMTSPFGDELLALISPPAT